MFRQNISRHRWYRHHAIINIRFVINLQLLMKMLVGMIMRGWMKMTVGAVHRRY